MNFKKRNSNERDREYLASGIEVTQTNKILSKKASNLYIKPKPVVSSRMDIDEDLHVTNDFFNKIEEDEEYSSASYNTDSSNEKNSNLDESDSYHNYEVNSINSSIKEKVEVNKKKPKDKYKKIEKVKEYDNNIEVVEDVNDIGNETNSLLDLPCRAKEQNEIESFIKKGLETSGCYSSLYISGMPGTGKTASVLASIKKLTKLSKRKQLKEFNSLLINGMKITNNNMVYKEIFSHLFKQDIKINPSKCCKQLDDFFKNRSSFNFDETLKDPRNLHLVLIIDEIDCLISKKMSLLYNMFNWSTYPEAKLIILSISNTIDLPQRVLAKVSSRMGNNHLAFKPYLKEDLQSILKEILVNYNNYTTDAIAFCCTKVASISGDIRRILAICRYAEDSCAKKYSKFEYSQINKKQKMGQVTLSDIKTAIKELYDEKIHYIIKSLKLYEKLAIIAISMEVSSNDSLKKDVSSIYNRFKFCANKIDIHDIPNFDEFKKVIFNLNRMKLITLTLFEQTFMELIFEVLTGSGYIGLQSLSLRLV